MIRKIWCGVVEDREDPEAMAGSPRRSCNLFTATCECGPKVINLKENHHGKEHSPQIAALHAFEPRELGPSSQQFWALGFFTRVQAQTKKGAYAHVRWNHDGLRCCLRAQLYQCRHR